MKVDGISGIFANQSFPMDRGTLVFGRSTSSCNVVFPDNARGISRNHCKIEKSGEGWIIVDLGSSYGTFVNGIKVQQNVPMYLNNGDTFYLGDKSNMFCIRGDSNAAQNIPGNQVAYLSQENFSQKGAGRRKVWIGVAAVIIIVLGMGIFFAGQTINELERQMEEEQNKGFADEVIDALNSFFD